MPNKLKGEFAGIGIYSILKLVPVGIIILESPSGKITYANDHAIELYGAKPEILNLFNRSLERKQISTKVYQESGQIRQAIA